MTWYFRIEHVPTGRVLIDAPYEEGSIEQITDDAIEPLELSRAPADGHIPAGCGEFRTEIRRTEEYEPAVCWEALDWFGSV